MELLDLLISQVAADDMGDFVAIIVGLKASSVLSHQYFELLRKQDEVRRTLLKC